MASKKLSFADDGWAVWVEGDDVSTIYINDWLNPKGKSYVDLAVRIRGVMASKSLNIYVPFEISQEDIDDTSLKLTDERVLRAIFSAACLVDFNKNECTSEVAYNGKTIDIIHISKISYELRQVADGTIISVDLTKIHQFLDNDECYFLFRLPHKSIDEIFAKKVEVGNILERLRALITSPVVSKKYGYSIRINESRLLPAEINRIGSFHRQRLKKAVVTISIAEDCSLNDDACYRIRRLEEDLYKDYAPADYDRSDVITYQWNQDRDDEFRGHFYFYFNIESSQVSKISMFLYMIIVLIVGAAGNAIWDIVKFIFKIKFEY